MQGYAKPQQQKKKQQRQPKPQKRQAKMVVGEQAFREALGYKQRMLGFEQMMMLNDPEYFNLF